MFIDTYHSRIAFAPNSLILCDQNVRTIQWDTASREDNETVWNTLTAFPCDRQTSFTHTAFYNLFEDMKDLTLKQITIHTDVSTMEIVPYGRKTITLTLSGQDPFTFYATPCFEASLSQTVQVLHTALFFLSCKTLQDAKNRLAKLQMLGAATQNLP